jgi:hypothetical protein
MYFDDEKFKKKSSIHTAKVMQSILSIRCSLDMLNHILIQAIERRLTRLVAKKVWSKLKFTAMVMHAER